MTTRGSWICLGLLAGLAGGGCGGGGDGLPRVLVTVRSNQALADVRQLDVTATSSGGTATLLVPEAPRAITLPVTFSVAFPKERTGLVTIKVSARDSANAVLSTGEAMVTLDPGGTVPLDVFLGGGGDDGGVVDAAPDDGAASDGAASDGQLADRPAIDAPPPDASAGPPPLLRWTWDGTPNNSGSMAGFPATLNGSTGYIAGKFGQAIQFGAGGYAQVPGTRTVMSSYATYTIAFWVFLSGSLSSQATFYTIQRTTAPYGGVSVGHTGTSASLCAASTTNSLLTGSCPTFNTTLNAWHHYLVRYAGTGTAAGQGAPVEIYLDDVRVATATQDTANNPVFNAGVPDMLSLGAPSFVAMDDLRIYNQVFTPAEQCTQIIGGTWTGASCTLPP